MPENLFVVLARHGVRVEAHQRAEAIRAALEAAPRPPAALPSALDATPEQLAQHLVSITHYAQLTDPKNLGPRSVDWQRRQLIEQLNAETRQAIRADADNIIGQLRPAFDAAADAARHVIGLGVAAGSTAEDMLDATSEQVACWRTFRDQHARTLDDLFDVRVRLSRIYDIAPVPSVGAAVDMDSVDWSACVTRPGATSSLAARDPRAPHVRWLAAADQLHLPLPSELAPSLAGTGLDATELAQEARRRAAQGGGEDETTASPTAALEASRPVWLPDGDGPTYPA